MGKKLLIVDDDEEMCSELSEILREEGYAVEVSHNGLEGKELILNNKYDLVLLDLKIPGLSGFGILKAIKENNVKVNVIVLSGRPMLKELKRDDVNYNCEEEDALKLASSVINKPFDINNIIKMISELTNQD